MKKIMFMINSLSGGGAEKVLQTLLNNLDYSKYDVTLYSMHREDIDTLDYPKQVHYKVVFDKCDSNVSLIKNVHELLSKIKGKIFQICPSNIFYQLYIHEKYDVEIAFIEGESTKIIAGSNNKKSKKYAWVHIDLQENPWTDFLYKGIQDEAKHYRKFDKIFCVSESVRKSFLEKYNIENEKVDILYNPVDEKKIIEQSKIPCDYIQKHCLRMVASGRLVKQKGFDRLLKVVNELKKDGYKFELIILGEGEERKKLEDQIKTLGLMDIVKLLGFQKNPYNIMATGDVLVVSSRAEGYSTVVTEGMILGLPVIATECAGMKELFGNMKCGYITKNNTNDLYMALRKVLEYPQKLELYREQVEVRRKNFLLKNTMLEIEKLLDS